VSKPVTRTVQLFMILFVLLFIVVPTHAVVGALCFVLGGLVMMANDIDWTETEGER
jgi:hypothetical protein